MKPHHVPSIFGSIVALPHSSRPSLSPVVGFDPRRIRDALEPKENRKDKLIHVHLRLQIQNNSNR